MTSGRTLFWGIMDAAGFTDAAKNKWLLAVLTINGRILARYVGALCQIGLDALVISFDEDDWLGKIIAQLPVASGPFINKRNALSYLSGVDSYRDKKRLHDYLGGGVSALDGVVFYQRHSNAPDD